MRGVVELAAAAHVADDGRPGLDADARATEPQPLAERRAPHLLGGFQQCKRARDRAPRVVLQRERRIEDRVDRIADDLVDHAAVVGDDACRDVEIGVEQRDEIGGFRALGHAGEAFDVGEQRGDLAHLAAQAQRGGIGGDAAHHLGRQMLFEAEAQQPGAPLVACKANKRGQGKRDDRDGGRADRIHQHGKAGNGRNRRGSPGETDEHREQRRHGWP